MKISFPTDTSCYGPERETGEVITESQRSVTGIDTGALQDAIFNSAYFSSIATDEKGVIQIFNVGAEHMLGFAAADVVNRITPADISDPQELIARAEALSRELGEPISPGFEALVFKASRGIEDIYELTYVRKDGSRFLAMVSVTALRDPDEQIIGYLLIGTDNTARQHWERTLQEKTPNWNRPAPRNPSFWRPCPMSCARPSTPSSVSRRPSRTGWWATFRKISTNTSAIFLPAASTCFR